MYPSIPSGLLSRGLISHMCKVSDWGQDWLWTTETQWNQTLDLGLISNRIKPIELIVYRHFALNNLQLKRGRPESEKKYIMILMVTTIKEEARPLNVRFHPFHRVCCLLWEQQSIALLVKGQAEKRAAGLSRERLCACVGVCFSFVFKCNFALLWVLRIYFLKSIHNWRILWLIKH